MAAFALIYQALLRCGARPGELAAATVADYQRDKQRIVLEHHKTERTGHPRTILVSHKLAELLRQSLEG